MVHHREEDLIGIPFPNHSSDVLCSLNEQRREGLLCDVILIVRDQEYRTHRSVLAACSQYFKKLFTVANADGGDHHQTAAVYEIDFVAPDSLTDEGSRKDEQEDEEDNVSERSLQSSESRGGQTTPGTEDSPPPSTSTYHQQFELHRESSQSQSPDTVRGKQVESVESRALKDFSIESLLQEGLYPRMSTLDRRANFSPLLPGFYPSMWAAEFPTFPKQLLDPSHHQHPHTGASQQSRLPHAFPKSAPLEASRPLDLEIPLSLLHGNFLKEFVSSGLSSTMNAGSVPSEGHALGPLKDEADFRSYLSFLSSASHLGGLFPPWQLEEERKMKPKASQQCPICNKVIQGAGKLPRHMRTHTGEKPYMCTICEVRFTRYVKQHFFSHHHYFTKSHCYKSFTRSDHLHRHIKRQSCRLSKILLIQRLHNSMSSELKQDEMRLL
uniref:Zinc finger and BTB domain containing 7C n=1 Tax=Sander lucioperca TaxID=283035 RepID=A0A8C9XWM3_SANLU